MSSRLASLLVQGGHVPAKRMAEAFQRQVIYGGTLDTILLEMGAVDEPLLLDALARASELPAASELPPPEILAALGADEWFPRPLAERYRAVPVGRQGELIEVAAVDPVDREQLEELGRQLGARLEPRVVLEHRFYGAIEAIYHAPCPARFASLSARLRQRAGEPIKPPAPALAPSAPAPAQTAPAPATPSPAAMSSAGEATPLPIEQAIARIEAASERDAVLRALCRGIRAQLSFVWLVAIHGDTAAARFALADSWRERADLEDIKVALDRPSPLRTVVLGRAPYLGRLGDEKLLHDALAALGRRPPLQGLLLPIVLRERVVAVAGADDGGAPIDSTCLADLSRLAAAAARAFQRLILESKGGAPPRPAGDGRGPLPDADDPPEFPGDPTRRLDPQDLDSLVLALVRDDHGHAAAEALLSLGERGAEALIRHLPGPVGEPTDPRPLAAEGLLLAVLTRFPGAALRPVLGRLDDRLPQVRYYAARLCGEARLVEAVPLLGARLFDLEPRVRRAAAEALARFSELPELRSLMAGLRAELTAPEASRQRCAADALAVLRDLGAVPELIELVKHQDAEVGAAARRALVQITQQDFGSSQRRWRGWWHRHQHEPRQLPR